MRRLFSGALLWNKMAGLSSAGRVPGVVAAAAALATAATSVGFTYTDRLPPMVSPILFYSANSALLPSASSSSVAFPSASCCLRSASGNLSADSWPFMSLPLVQESPTSGPAMASLYSTLGVVSHVSPRGRFSLGPGSTSFLSGAISPAKGFHCLSYPSLAGPSLIHPSCWYSALELSRDELHSHFMGHALKGMSPSSFSEFMHSAPAIAASSSSLNSPSFDTFDLATHLASFFAVVGAPPSHPRPLAVSSKSLHKWHSPVSGSLKPGGDESQTTTKPALTVVLLGWLGSQQKHLKKYAEWYNARGINAVTFTLPMADILRFSNGGKAEEYVEQLTTQLSTWLESNVDKCAERQLIFHTFSNTGWLTYGVVLEKLSSGGTEWVDRIKGCVIDSAPAPDPDPRVWASGFSAALLKKRSSASNGGGRRDSGIADSRHKIVVDTSKPHIAESALLALLEKFFFVFLQIPAIDQRLSQVVTVLSKEQPRCPQLYIYSTADKVIPVNMVESFMEKQRQQGRIVRGCNFQSSPHVDHFRSFPDIYSKQVSNFLQECLQESSSK